MSSSRDLPRPAEGRCAQCGGEELPAGWSPEEGRQEHLARCVWCHTIFIRDGTSSRTEVRGSDAREVEQVALAVLRESRAHDRVGPWASGSFYLLALILVIVALGVIASAVSVWIIPVIAAGGLLGLTMIGALQLRQDGALREESFLRLMTLTLQQLPLVRSAQSSPVEVPNGGTSDQPDEA
jgi:hypothetical protein